MWSFVFTRFWVLCLSSADDDIDSNGSCMWQEESQMDKSYEETVTDSSDNEDDYEDLIIIRMLNYCFY